MSAREGAERGSAAVDFGVFIRSGRLVPVRGSIEVKFNPYHDPKDGRFTFGPGGGLSGARSTSSDAEVARKPTSAPKLKSNRGTIGGGRAADSFDTPKKSQPKITGKDGSFGGAGATGSWNSQLTGGDDQSFGGAGATGSWEGEKKTPSPAVQPSATSKKLTLAESHQRNWHVVSRNGYDYILDENDRVRQVTGDLEFGPAQNRSQKNQREAGGDERRALDDGGHYIAPRFDGPTDAFNHFAQDRNFNRGAYRVLEDQWAAAKRQSKKVWVDITPFYQGTSVRPYKLVVRYTINGVPFRKDFPNERTRK